MLCNVHTNKYNSILTICYCNVIQISMPEFSQQIRFTVQMGVFYRASANISASQRNLIQNCKLSLSVIFFHVTQSRNLIQSLIPPNQSYFVIIPYRHMQACKKASFIKYGTYCPMHAELHQNFI
jgi:hypothetical protein